MTRHYLTIIFSQVHLYSGIDDEDPEIHVMGDHVCAMTLSQSKFFVAASSSNKVIHNYIMNYVTFLIEIFH